MQSFENQKYLNYSHYTNHLSDFYVVSVVFFSSVFFSDEPALRLAFSCSATFWINSIVRQYFSLGTLVESNTQIAKSFVMKPFSTVWITDFSKVWTKCSSYLLLSSFALCSRPLVQAKILAIEFVEVYWPFWCIL